MMSLLHPEEMLSLITPHLKPRHFIKLMLASKRLLHVVDCEFYWERAAAHAVLRHVYEMDPGASQICRFDKRPGLFQAIIMVDPDNYRHIHAAFAESAQTMKEVERRETRRVLDEQTSVGRKLRKFQRELDDAVEGSEAACDGKFETLFEDVAHDEMVETELYKFWHMAQDFV